MFCKYRSRHFIQKYGGDQSMSNKKAPALFVGHGSPLNAIENNEFTAEWERLSQDFNAPNAILSVSAHWHTDGTRITDDPHPKMIYDMYGFPEELYRVAYPAKGASELAHATADMIESEVVFDRSWGYDHGTWSVLSRMYPHADIPVYQMSVNRNANVSEHYRIGQNIAKLREQGVMIFGSGNIVHNLSMANYEMSGGYPFAEQFDRYIAENIKKRDFEKILQYNRVENGHDFAFITPDHYDPLLYVLGASDESDQLHIFNKKCVMGSMSMTSYLFRNES